MVYGRDERAIEAAKLLADHLDVTVLISRPKDLAPPRVTEFPVVKGTIRSAKGHFGAFELTVDDYAAPAPSSRGALSFGTARNGAVSHCDLVVDLSGERAAVCRARPARRLPPRRSRRSGGCAHRRTQGARSGRRFRQAALHHVHRRALRAFALEDRRLPPLPRSLPDRRDRARRRSRGDRSEHLRRLRPVRGRLSRRAQPLTRCRPPTRCCASCARCSPPTARPAARAPSCCCTMSRTGAPLIDALARHGDGLPANVLPLAVNEVTQVGLEAVAAAFAYGASAIRFLTRAKPHHDVAGLRKTIALAEPILARPRLRHRTCRDHRDRRSVRARRNAARDRARRRRAAPGRVPARRGEARRAAARVARIASCGTRAGRYRRAARGRAVRHGRAQRRGLHAVPLLRLGLPDRRAVGRAGAPGAALRRGRLRAVRAVQGDLPRESHHAHAPARLPRRGTRPPAC